MAGLAGQFCPIQMFHVYIYPQNCPQMALNCYKEALETDPQCVCALYQSILVYRQLDNTQAEIQALRLLHSVGNTSTLHIQSVGSGRCQICRLLSKAFKISCPTDDVF